MRITADWLEFEELSDENKYWTARLYFLKIKNFKTIKFPDKYLKPYKFLIFRTIQIPKFDTFQSTSANLKCLKILKE